MKWTVIKEFAKLDASSICQMVGCLTSTGSCFSENIIEAEHYHWKKANNPFSKAIEWIRVVIRQISSWWKMKAERYKKLRFKRKLPNLIFSWLNALEAIRKARFEKLCLFTSHVG